MNRPSDAYYAVLYPEPSSRISEFGRWKRLTTGRNIADAYWEARERARLNWQDATLSPQERQLIHPPVVLWLPQVACAACLGCEWLHPGSATLYAAAQLSRLHSVANGDPAAVVQNLPIPISERGAEQDEPLGQDLVYARIAGFRSEGR